MKRKQTVFTLMLLLFLLLQGAFAVSCTSAEEKQMQTAIGTCAGYEVLYEELRFVTLTCKDQMKATYGDDIWDDAESTEKYLPELEEKVWKIMRSNYAALTACAAYQLTADKMQDKSIVEAVDRRVETAKSQFDSEKEYRRYLTDSYLTEHLLRFLLSAEMMKNELLYVLTEDLGQIEKDEEKFYDWLKEGNYVPVQHIYIRNDSGDDPEKNRALAEEVRDCLRDGSKTLKDYINSSVNEDIYNVAPYYIVRGAYVQEVEDVVFDLQKEGDVSEVAEVEGGYYVFVRTEDKPEKLLSNLPTLLEDYQWAMVSNLVKEYENRVVIDLNEYGKSIRLTDIR